MKAQLRTAILMLVPAIGLAQVPVDDDGKVIGDYEAQPDVVQIGEDGIPRLSQSELQELVGPIALYPDDLLALVLPASAYPLQIVEAARFLEALEDDSSLEPDPDWDDSVVALTNYPEVIELLNEDLDWTLRLGEAMVAQQAEVVAAVEAFRDRAYAAGNLKSDTYQTVSRDEGVISIEPATEDVIYVPYYEPARVVYYQPRPVYHYYPRSYPVYYYPYAAGHHFRHGYFWGVTTAFSIGWLSDSLHVYHHSYHGHPYYGRSYYRDYWYRRPSISVYNTHYFNNRRVTVNRYSHGDRWRPSNTRRTYVRREGYSRSDRRRSEDRRSSTRQVSSRQSTGRTVTRESQRDQITFRERESRPATRTQVAQTRSTNRTNANRSNSSRETRREVGDVRVRGNQQRSTNSEQRSGSRQRSSGNQERSTIQFRDRTQETRRQAPVARTERQQSTVNRSRDTRSQATVRQPQVRPSTRVEQRAPVVRQQRQRSEPREQRRQTARPQQQRSEPREQRQQTARPQQPSRQQASRSQERSSSGANAGRSERRSSENRGRARDRQRK